PLRHSGLRISPTRARPVPFCRHGFFPLPDTSARVFVLCVPRRRLARYCFTARCIRPSLISPANTASARSSLPTTSLFKFLISTVAIVTALTSPRRHSRPLGPALHRAQREDCFPDQSARREGSEQSPVRCPCVRPFACPSTRAKD